MSTRVGTLQGSRAGRSIWPAAILASLAMLTIAVAAVSLGQDEAPTARPTVVQGTAANTPSELRGGIPQTSVGGASANTPTELSGGIRHKYVSDALGTNTPTELSGGLTPIGDARTLHQRI